MNRLAVWAAAAIATGGQWVCLPASADETGIASFYSTSPPTGTDLTAAHRQLPFGTRVRVTRPDTGRQVVVLINDRGPFVAGRVIDLSPAAARQLEMTDAGVTAVRLEILPAEQPIAGHSMPVD